MLDDFRTRENGLHLPLALTHFHINNWINHFFYILVTVHFCIILINNQLDAQFLLYIFISIFYMFRANFPTCIPDGHLHRVTYTGCCIDTIASPDDEHKVARNM